MSHNEHDDLEDEVLDDDALELAAGGMMTTKPTGGGDGGYSYNSTIYFQTSITNEV
jgi:hypothetical protein